MVGFVPIYARHLQPDTVTEHAANGKRLLWSSYSQILAPLMDTGEEGQEEEEEEEGEGAAAGAGAAAARAEPRFLDGFRSGQQFAAFVGNITCDTVAGTLARASCNSPTRGSCRRLGYTLVSSSFWVVCSFPFMLLTFCCLH